LIPVKGIITQATGVAMASTGKSSKAKGLTADEAEAMRAEAERFAAAEVGRHRTKATPVREPTLDEIRAAVSTGAGEMEVVRAAAGYLRIRFGWACDQRDALRDALAVMVLDRRISAWLAENDPKALEQAEAALVAAGYPLQARKGE
jgi:hypothetical protein